MGLFEGSKWISFRQTGETNRDFWRRGNCIISQGLNSITLFLNVNLFSLPLWACFILSIELPAGIFSGKISRNNFHNRLRGIA